MFHTIFFLIHPMFVDCMKKVVTVKFTPDALKNTPQKTNSRNSPLEVNGWKMFAFPFACYLCCLISGIRAVVFFFGNYIGWDGVNVQSLVKRGNASVRRLVVMPPMVRWALNHWSGSLPIAHSHHRCLCLPGGCLRWRFLLLGWFLWRSKKKHSQ